MTGLTSTVMKLGLLAALWVFVLISLAVIRTGTPSVISDLGSTNGIVVDDQHVRQAQLRDGSVIHLGNTTIVFRQV